MVNNNKTKLNYAGYVLSITGHSRNVSKYKINVL